MHCNTVAKFIQVTLQHTYINIWVGSFGSFINISLLAAAIWNPQKTGKRLVGQLSSTSKWKQSTQWEAGDKTSAPPAHIHHDSICEETHI